MAHVDLLQLVGTTLLTHDGSGGVKQSPSSDLNGKVVGIYFSAHWCPPCRQFTPLLVQTYNKLRAEGKEFEVVFVSSDKSLPQFQEYFGQMPWRAVPFDDVGTRRRLSQQFSVMGIPTLAIVAPDGRILTANGRAAVMRDPQGTQFPWEGAAGTSLQGLLGNPMLVLLLFVALWKPQASGSILAAPSRPNPGLSWSSFTGGNLFGSGNRLCFLQGYYALAFLVAEYKVEPVITDSIDSAVAKVNGGDCAAFAYESAVPAGEIDLPPLSVPPAYVSPYGIGIRRGDQELHDAIALALLAAMDKGNTSAILQYEEDHLVKNGVPPNKALTNLVTAISSFDIPTSTAVPKIPSTYSFLGR
ncbi:hypothetical protein N2152v2_009810 [Parachlorella kessleri]